MTNESGYSIAFDSISSFDISIPLCNFYDIYYYDMYSIMIWYIQYILFYDIFIKQAILFHLALKFEFLREKMAKMEDTYYLHSGINHTLKDISMGNNADISE